MQNTVQIVLNSNTKLSKSKCGLKFAVNVNLKVLKLFNCCAVLFCVVLCCACLCCTVLGYAVLSCVVLCCAVPSNNIATIFLLFRSPWKARECFQGRRYSKESDVWAFGIVLWEMFMKTVPFQNMEDDTVIVQLLFCFVQGEA